MADTPTGYCASCGSALAPEQHYCLVCGARTGPRSPQLAALIERVRASSYPPAPERPAPEAPTGAPAPARHSFPVMPALSLPSPWVSALLVLGFLGFGVLMGDAASSGVQDSLAASSGRHVRVLTPASPAGAPTSSGSEGAGESSSEAPETASTSTPETSPTPASTTASPQAAAGSSEPESESAEGGSSEGSGAAKPLTKLPPVKHVFLIMLSDQPYASVFGPSSTVPYLSGTLEKQGELLVDYDAVAHEALANEVALISGQGPTVETAANCTTYTEVAQSGTGEYDQVLGSGCVYPKSTATLPGQLAGKHLTWRAYVQGMDEPGSAGGACAHPALGAHDPTSGESPASGTYSTFRNPFVYFQSITDSSSCASNDVGLSTLSHDLSSVAGTPNLSYIVPDRCHDGNPTPCAPTAPAGLAQSEAFLKKVVPEITGSKAYKEDGLLVITVDQAPSSGELEDSSSCCGQPKFPNVPAKTTALTPRGGGAVGALLLSPFVKGASTNQEPFSHFSLLRTIEDLFGLPHLGYAQIPQLKPLPPAMFTAKKG